ncbi:MAG TPA: hypothetical protein QF626_05365, partial [Prochlorococcaceae cyanobacterium Fu_MAG_50]|nr:hypothetical protein [Prochlorococcaceae cyanobacterium Fu_MAG_50]
CLPEGDLSRLDQLDASRRLVSTWQSRKAAELWDLGVMVPAFVLAQGSGVAGSANGRALNKDSRQADLLP